MEKIKQALERARQERARQDVVANTAAATAAVPKSVGATGAPSAGARGALNLARVKEGAATAELYGFKDKIRYTETHNQPVAPEVFERNRLFNGRGRDPVTSAYKVLRTQVLHRLEANGWNTLGVVSAVSGEGKSLTALNLAFSLAQEASHTVLLVDFDLRRPGLHKYLEYQPRYGVEDYLWNDVPLSEILFSPGIEGMVLLPAKQTLSNSAEVLSSPKMRELVGELKSRYPSRIVLFDLPPLLEVADSRAFVPYIDAALLVVADGRTRKENLERALEVLRGVQLLGTVLNESDTVETAAY